MIRAALFLIAISGAGAAYAHPAKATYLANEGVLIERGETKILFDPLFGESFGTYELVPMDMVRAMMSGEAPFDGVDAVFVSHAHDDHFAETDMIAYLRSHETARLYAPRQAVDRMIDIIGADSPLLERVTAIALERLDEPERISVEGLQIEAVRIPHAGWPARAEVENIVFRVTLDDGVTVMHLGDADPSDAHFEPHQRVWDERDLHAAFPPYWFFGSEEGRAILDDRLKAETAIGIHVPASAPDDPAKRPPAYQDVDLFTRPGETREIAGVAD